MAQLFVSHSSQDNEFATKLREVLGDLGYESVFLDFDATDGLVPGQAWREQLFTNIDASDALVLITTPASNASKWCHSELALARWLRKPLLCLLVDDSDPHELTADLQGLKVSSTELDRDRVKVALQALGLEQTSRWDASQSPFPGLRAFDESYAAVFFGRDRQIEQLRQLVDPPSRSRQGAVIPVLGPSGSGKSSMVRAGLVPALRPSPDWVISEPWTPSDVPLAEMALALSHAAKLEGCELDADACAELLRTPGGMADYLRKLRAGGSVGADAKVLVVIDQAEELVTLTPEAERRAFLDALATSCAAPSPLRVVMTARTDMWDSVSAETSRAAATVAPTVLHVPPLTRSDLAEIIREPAKRSHLSLEDGLVQRMVEDTGSGEALPLLAFTLARMASGARDGALTHAGYDAIGGVRGAIASRAEEVAHGDRSQADVAEAVLHLVNVSDAKPHKRLARAADIPERHRQILDELVDARLVVVSELNDQQVYAPAHEALLSAWQPLADLIEDRTDDLRLRGRLERRAADWRDSGATTSGLLSGLELDQARLWQTRNPDLATAEIAAYVDSSARRERRGRLVRASVVALVAALGITLVVVVLVNARADRRQAQEARIGEQVAIAEKELVHDPPAAAIALLRGLSFAPDDAELTATAERLLAAPARNVVRAEGDDPADSPWLSGSAGDRWVVVGGAQGVLAFDTANPANRRSLPEAAVSAIRPDGRVAVLLRGSGLEVYDLAPEEPAVLAIIPRTTTVMSFSPDGSLLAIAVGREVQVWDLGDPASPERLATWQTNQSQLTAVRVRDDGLVLASGNRNQLAAWNPFRGSAVRTIVANAPTQGSPILRIDTDSSATQALLSGSSVFGNTVYDLADDGPVGTFSAVPDLSDAEGASLQTATFTTAMDRDGEHVAAFNLAGKGYAFGVADREGTATLSGGHTSTTTVSVFTGTGELMSAGFDGTVRTWDITGSSDEGDDDVADRLCETFGAYLDEDSWRLAEGDSDFVSPCPDAPSSKDEPPLELPAPTQRSREPAEAGTVADEPFEGGVSLFVTGPADLGGGSMSRTIEDGEFRLAMEGVAPDYHAWTTLGVPGIGSAWSVDTVAESVDGSGPCGLVVDDGTSQVVVTWDESRQRGELSRYGPERLTRPFDAPSGGGASDQLGVARDGDELVVRVGDREALRIPVGNLAAPTGAGMATVGAGHSCAFDEFTVDESS